MRTLIVILCLARAAAAQVPEAGHVCVENCGGGSSSSSSADDARMQEAFRQEKADEIRIDAENAARASKERRIHTIRKDNELGVKAFQAKQWGLAEVYFSAALRVDPNNGLAQRNLEAARAAIATARAQREAALAQQRRDAALAEARRAMDAEQHRLAKLLAHGPAVPPPGSGLANAGNALAPTLPLALPDANAFIANAARQRLIAAGNDVVAQAKRSLDIMTPEGLFLRVEINVTKLATETVPQMLTSAVSGDALPEALPGAQGATVVMNVGAAPGDMAEKLVELGDAGKVVLDEAKQKAEKLLDGITTLTIHAGAQQVAPGDDDAAKQVRAQFDADARGLLQAVQQLPIVQRWTGATK